MRNERYYPCDGAYVENDEICYIDYDKIANRYDLIFSYDSGYCYGRIKDIKFCPLCGRELNEGMTRDQLKKKLVEKAKEQAKQNLSDDDLEKCLAALEAWCRNTTL